VVGHGRFSGPFAQGLRAAHFPAAKYVYFVHSSPLDTEHLKEYQQDTYVLQREKRLAEELASAGKADLVACVGPRLSRYMRDALMSRGRSDRVVRIDCGISNDSREYHPPAQPTLLSLGRTDSIGVKGLDLFALAAGHLLKKWQSHPATRDRPRPRFVVRGAKDHPEALATTLQEIGARFSPDLKIIVRPYTTSAADLQADFTQASAFVMPSREEGFGLVACEALSSGVPVIVSSESGIAEVIRDLAKQHFFEIGPTVLDLSGAPDAIAARLAGAVLAILEDESRAAHRTHLLRQKLFLPCSWDAAADTLFGALFPSSGHPSESKPRQNGGLAARVAGSSAATDSLQETPASDLEQPPRAAILVTDPRLHSHLRKDLRSFKESWCGMRRYDFATLPEGSTARVSLLLVSGAGNLDSAVKTTLLLRDLQPELILLLGSASGLEASGVALGDVIIAGSIIHYEPGHVDAAEISSRYSFVYKTPRLLEEVARSVAARRSQPPTQPSKSAVQSMVHLGVVASGDKVFRAPTQLTNELGTSFGVLGFETEAAGVAEAVSQAGILLVSVHSVDRLLVEGGASADPNETNATKALEIGLAIVDGVFRSPSLRRLLSRP
jgi:glycosyltransferase involved in cell wall biosynthesis/nucleoside phosphorylase